jgi:hypothetical protein
MYQHHLITTELADLRRRDLQSDADRHRRVPRDSDRTRRIFRWS